MKPILHLLAGLMTITAATTLDATTTIAATPPRSLYWGAAVDASLYGYPYEDPRAWDRFEASVGKRVSILSIGRSWYVNGTPAPFPAAKLEQIRQRGSIPMLSWAPRGTPGAVPPNDPAFRPAVVTGGLYDAFIRQWARDARAWAHPMFLRFAWEMDGWWYPYGEGRQPDGTATNGNQPGDYARMWRHVHTIFTQEGATNVTWVWCVNHETTSAQYPPLGQLYPGDQYVDWTAMDPYNRYPQAWLTFDQTIRGTGTTWLANTFDRVKAVAPNKPMMIAETGSREDAADPGRKAAWIRDLLATQLAARALIGAVIYFDATPDVWLGTSPQARQAFRDGIADPRYKTNLYANLPPGRIPPP